MNNSNIFGIIKIFEGIQCHKGVVFEGPFCYTTKAVARDGGSKKREQEHLENYIVQEKRREKKPVILGHGDVEKKNEWKRKEFERPSEEVSYSGNAVEIELKSLILAQDERWRRA